MDEKWCSCLIRLPVVGEVRLIDRRGSREISGVQHQNIPGSDGLGDGRHVCLIVDVGDVNVDLAITGRNAGLGRGEAGLRPSNEDELAGTGLSEGDGDALADDAALNGQHSARYSLRVERRRAPGPTDCTNDNDGLASLAEPRALRGDGCVGVIVPRRRRAWERGLHSGDRGSFRAREVGEGCGRVDGGKSTFLYYRRSAISLLSSRVDFGDSVNLELLELSDKLRYPDFICCIDRKDRSRGNPAKECRAEIVNPKRINFDILKKWLKTCDTNHDHGVTSAPSLDKAFSSPLKLIDCKTRKVILASRSDTYIALSYTWDSTEKSRDSSKSVIAGDSLSLPEQPPRVILDAVALVLQISHRYLWVDQYCIDQDNDAELRGQ